MPSAKAPTTEEVLAARTALTRGAPDADLRFRALLGRPARRARTVREWHDLLLFVRAHPYATDIPALADTELASLVASLRGRRGDALLNSGIAGTPTTSSFSLPLVQWLLSVEPSAFVGLESDASPDEVVGIIRALLHPAEREAVDLQGFTDTRRLLRYAFGGKPRAWLPRLLSALSQTEGDALVRAHLFERLGLTHRIRSPRFGVTFARWHGDTPVLVDGGLQRAADAAAACALPPPREVRLSATARRGMIETARIVLASLQRETDPITNAETVTLHEMGRGVFIALFPLAMGVRLPFDSYVGFLAFRNGVPLAYGGAWIYPGRSKIGLNVFPLMRGGESAWFFTQLLRLYRHRFDVHVFEAENYQLGHGNAEGLKSGAYWFYYRIGFRPTDPRVADTAAHAFAQMQANPGYRVPLTLLRALVAEGLELTIAADPVEPTDTGALTLAVQAHIVRTNDGDRRRAQRSAERRLARVIPGLRPEEMTGEERAALALWSVALDAIPDLETWTLAERRSLGAIVRAKGEPDERRHQRLLRHHRRLLDAWRRLALSAS